MTKPEIHAPTKAGPVGEGRSPALDPASASAIAEANAAAGFPSPPIVEAALDAPAAPDGAGAKTAAPPPTPQTDKPAKSGAAN